MPINEDDGRSAPSFYHTLDGSWRQWYLFLVDGYHVVSFLDCGDYGVGYGSICSVSVDIPNYLFPFNRGSSSNTSSYESCVRLLMSLELREKVDWLYPSVHTSDLPPYLMLSLPKIYFTNFVVLPIPSVISEILLYSGVCFSQLGAAFFFYVWGFCNLLRDLDIVPTARLFFHYFTFHNVPRSNILIACTSRPLSLYHSPLLSFPPTKRKMSEFIFVDSRFCPGSRLLLVTSNNRRPTNRPDLTPKELDFVQKLANRHPIAVPVHEAISDIFDSEG